MDRNTLSYVILLSVLLLTLPIVIALNDPGHDTLYVLKVGDSNVTGSINVSGNLTSSYVRAATLLYGDQLDIRANGSIFSVTNRPAIQADSEDLYLDSKNNIYLATKGGTTGLIQIGPVTGSALVFNVSGTIYERGIRVCLADGTNCPGGNNTGNISTVTAGVGLVNTGTGTDPVLGIGIGAGLIGAADEIAVNTSYLQRRVNDTCAAGSSIRAINDDGSVVCEADTEGTGADGTGGWTNTSTATITQLRTIVNSSSNAGSFVVQNTSGGAHLFVNGSTGFVGIGNASPTVELSLSSTGVLAAENINTKTGLSSGFVQTTYISSGRYGSGVGGGTSYLGYAYVGTGGSSYIGYSNFGSGGTTYISTSSELHGGDVYIAQGGAEGNGGTTHIGAGTGVSSSGGALHVGQAGSFGMPGNLIAYGNIGAGTTAANQRLTVNGSVNVSGTSAKLYTPELCLSGNCQTAWPSGADGTGGWTNDTTTTSTALNVDVYNASNSSQRFFYVNQTSGFVGIGATAVSNGNTKLRVVGQIDATGNVLGSWASFQRFSDADNNSYYVNPDANSATASAILKSTVGIGTTVPTRLLDVNGTSGFIGNTTYALPGTDSEVCFERFVGTTQNYTRCINSTGHVTERFGQFAVN